MAKRLYLDDNGLNTLVNKIKNWVLGLGYTSNTGTITEVTTSSPLSGSGTSGSVALSHEDSGVTDGSYGDSSNQSPAFGETFKVNYETVNATGHVTEISSHDVTIPDTVASESENGLMSASDKETLDSITSTGTINFWIMDEDGNVILGDDDSGLITEVSIIEQYDEDSIVNKAVDASVTASKELVDSVLEYVRDYVLGGAS